MRHAWLAFAALVACNHASNEPPNHVAPEPTTVESTPPTAATSPPSPILEPSASASAAPAEPPLLDSAGKLLPQTEDEPTSSPLFRERTALLFRAIVEDDPELARPFFFPLKAYEAVKAIADPATDWNNRLWKLFVRDIHEYHKQVGEGAKLVAFEPRAEAKKWMKPNSEGNRIGYWRATRNQLSYLDGSGKQRTLEVTSLISWRGEWYVVHLHGFQ